MVTASLNFDITNIGININVKLAQTTIPLIQTENMYVYGETFSKYRKEANLYHSIFVDGRIS